MKCVFIASYALSWAPVFITLGITECQSKGWKVTIALKRSLGLAQDVASQRVSVLLLDAYASEERYAVQRRAFGHRTQAWILRLAELGKKSFNDLISSLTLLSKYVCQSCFLS